MYRIDPRAWRGTLILSAAILIVSCFYHSNTTLLISAAALVGHLLFFRDPRPSFQEGDDLLSPASGKISDITILRDEEFLKEEAIRIGIFLSIFDAHVNAFPLTGTVRHLKYIPGRFVNALNAQCSKVNESNWVGIENPQHGRLLVRQISGAIARKIFWDVKAGDQVKRGQKLGIICYGSRVEVFIPKKSFTSQVQVGDRVHVGKTILGSWI